MPPNDWSDRISIFYEGQEPPQDFLRGHEFEVGIRVDANFISPRYFQTLGTPLVQGRDFSDQDKEDAPRVVILSQKLAHRLWPGETAIGKRFAWPTLEGPPRPALEVVGVAQDTKYRSLLNDAPLLLYLPVLQNYDGRETLVVRAAGDPGALIPAVRSEVAALDSRLPVFAVKTMDEHIAASLWKQRMAAGLISTFGLLAIVLATFGLYGVIAYSVSQRTREIGVRMALGAQARDVLRLVVGKGFRLVVMGVFVGLASAFALTRLMSSFLFGVTPTDPATFTAVAVLLSLVALLACYIPARRASRIDPMVALRYE